MKISYIYLLAIKSFISFNVEYYVAFCVSNLYIYCIKKQYKTQSMRNNQMQITQMFKRHRKGVFNIFSSSSGLPYYV